MNKGNLLDKLPTVGQGEVFEALLERQGVLIERIVSRGQCSAPDFWYESRRTEWVLLLRGSARLMWGDGSEQALESGDYVTIPAHCRHRVAWTAPDQETVWLAVHLPEES